MSQSYLSLQSTAIMLCSHIHYCRQESCAAGWLTPVCYGQVHILVIPKGALARNTKLAHLQV